MRGKVDQQSMLCSCKGITPAYAGKRVLFRFSRTVSWDHPRLCGEKVLLERPLDTVGGSPPPMRGKVRETSAPAGYVRITPAYAGKRPHYAPLYSVMQGSPPPMRGKVSKENVPVLINGITPAYAGKRFQIYCRLILL